MPDKSPREIERMVKKAKKADQNADRARRVVDEAKAHRRRDQWEREHENDE